MLFKIVKALSWYGGRWLFKLTADHADHVPQTGSVLVVANHASYLDPPLVGAPIRHRDTYYMARANLFRIPGIRWLLKAIHAFPVKTKGDWREGMEQAFQLFDRGEVVVVFPEGTRTRDGNLQKGKPGIGWLAYRAKVTVVPAYISGTYEALPRGSLMIKSSRVKVVFGPPLDLTQWYQGPEVRETYQRIADEMIEGIRRAGEQNKKSEVRSQKSELERTKNQKSLGVDRS